MIILTSLTQISIGYNGYDVSNLMEKNIDENEYSKRFLKHSFYDCYSVNDLLGCFNNEVSIYQEKEESRVRELYGNNQRINGSINSPWPMYCHDRRHTGRSPYSTSNNVGFNNWWYKCDWYIEGSAAIDHEGTIYYGGAERNSKALYLYLYALYPNGSLKWKCEIDDLIASGPVIAEDGTIYVGECIGNDNLYSISPTGIINWKYQANGEIFSSPVVGSDGTIIFGDGNNYINAINPNGTLKWRYKTDFLVYSSPAIGDDGIIYCGSHDNYLYALYPNNGTLKWKYKTGHWIRTSPCIGDDGTIYCVSLDNLLHAVNPDGICIWKINVGGGTSPIIGLDGTIYCGWDYLHAVNPNGSIKWKFDPGDSRVIEGGTPCISADGTIYFGTRIDPYFGGEIIAVDSDGNEKWRERIATEWCQFAPVIGEGGTVYIGSSSPEYIREGALRNYGYFYAFNEKDVNAPSSPVINGPSNGNIQTYYDFTFKSSSPLGIDVYYWIDWGDGDWNRDIWIGPYESGKLVNVNHRWKYKGSYTIKARVKDTENLWSDWSESDITVIKSRDRATLDSVWFQFQDMFPIIQKIFAFIK